MTGKHIALHQTVKFLMCYFSSTTLTQYSTCSNIIQIGKILRSIAHEIDILVFCNAKQCLGRFYRKIDIVEIC